MKEENIENDDFCDLPDGSDETKTSACSHLKVLFTCSYDQRQIPTSRVQDGVCDCCDGSDELETPFPIFCPVLCSPNALNPNSFGYNLRRRYDQSADINLPKIHFYHGGIDHHPELYRPFNLRSFLYVVPFFALFLVCMVFLVKLFCNRPYRSPLDNPAWNYDPQYNTNGIFRRISWSLNYILSFCFRWRKSDERMH